MLTSGFVMRMKTHEKPFIGRLAETIDLRSPKPSLAPGNTAELAQLDGTC